MSASFFMAHPTLMKWLIGYCICLLIFIGLFLYVLYSTKDRGPLTRFVEWLCSLVPMERK